VSSLAACGGGGGGGGGAASSPPNATTTRSHSVGGAVTGLAGTMVLQNVGVDDLSVSGSGTFTFGTALPSGTGYLATVRTQPAGQSCVVANGSGTVGMADVTDLVVSCDARPAAALSVFAGDPAGAVGTAAHFNQPAGIAADLAGTVYVADQLDNTILKITPAGVVTTFAGTAGTSGSADATGPAASFYFPTSVATDRAGNVFVTDTANELVRKITPGGVVTTFAGTVGARGLTDGNGTAASFNLPYGAVTDRAGNLYVADSVYCTLRRITPAGDVTTPTGIGLGARQDCTGSGGRMNGPFGLATDFDGKIYVAHTQDHLLVSVTPTYHVTDFAGTPGLPGNVDGPGTAASFNSPLGVATDGNGNVYVADTLNHTVRRITPAGEVSTLAGVAGTAGFKPGTLPGLLSNPRGLAMSGTTLYITVDNGIARITNLP
jgi:hypothetical protein